MPVWSAAAPCSRQLPGEILLRCDATRLLPQTDPFSRQIMMSHATFLELLDIAARERGLRAETTLFPEGAFGPERIDARPVARVRLVPDTAVAKDPLFGQFLLRHTNRNVYELARPVPAQSWLGLLDRSRAPAADSFATTGQIKDFDRKVDSTPAFLWLISQGNERITQVNAGRAYARVQLAATALGLAMQPLQQALQEYPEQALLHSDIHRLLDAHLVRARRAPRPPPAAPARHGRPLLPRRAHATALPPKTASWLPSAKSWGARASLASASPPSPCRPAWTRC